MTATINAEGFVSPPRHEEPVTDDKEHVLRFSLEHAGAAANLHLQLPAGQPAAGAEVLLHQTGQGETMLRADPAGVVSISNSAKGALVLVRAEGAAWCVRRWNGEESRWRLELPAQPLTIKVVDSKGNPARNAPGILWLDGVRVSGGELAWLTATAGGADGGGYWTLRGLPARSVDLLMWLSTQENYSAVPNQLFDGMRVAVTYPWPSQLEMAAFE